MSIRTQEAMELFEPGDRPELFQRPSLFLSASIAYRRELPSDATEADRKRNERYVALSEPSRIREAIGHLCRFAFRRRLQVLFGGHPAISPLVLTTAKRFGEDPKTQKPVLVFQSAYFFDQIPQETLQLADWRYGHLLWTRRRTGVKKPRAGRMVGDSNRQASLSWMREVMVRSPQLLGAVFIGGMEGVVEEEALFREHNPGLPVFAIGSTGSAAQELLEQDPDRMTGHQADHRTLSTQRSYPLVMQRIFADLERHH